MLKIQNLKILYKNQPYVDDVNFHIDRGEIFSIVGESGSGKTLTGLSLLNLLPEYFKIEGSILLNNIDILSIPQKELLKIRGRKISLIFQDPTTSLNPVMKVGYQVAEMLIHHLNLSKKEAMIKTEDVFKKFKISHIINSYPHQLSGGMRQRVMIAMAIACDPEVIVADEPTTALDVTVQEEILDLLYFLVKTEWKSLLLITHDINIVGEYADRVMVLYAGKVMEMGKVEEILRNPVHPYTEALIECMPQEGKKIKSIPGSVPDLRKLPPGCVFHPRCQYKKEQCLKQLPPLIQLSQDHLVRCFK